MKIAGRPVGLDAPPFIIAELSGNHNGSLDRALAIVDAAAATGAHALKIQTYTADTMTLDIREREFVITDPKSPWAGRSLYELYEEAHTPWDWHAPIFERARRHGMIPFSTPFDFSAVDFLETLDAPCYKIASFENTDLPLIRKVAATGKPIIVSTGMATLGEIDALVRAAREAGCRDLVLLKCTSSYPASPANSNIRTIPALREAFGCEVGLSDHTLGVGVAVASVALGATVIEKHFTLDRGLPGPDHRASLPPDEFARMVAMIRATALALGDGRKVPTPAERDVAALVRRSWHAAVPIAAGATINAGDVDLRRPASGLPPAHSPVGRRAAADIAAGSPVAESALAPAVPNN